MFQGSYLGGTDAMSAGVPFGDPVMTAAQPIGYPAPMTAEYPAGIPVPMTSAQPYPAAFPASTIYPQTAMPPMDNLATY
jgi:hypothetical protein